MQFESLGAVSYLPSIVNMAVSVAVCDITECCDLKNRVTVRSRSLEMAPFDRSLTSSYSPSIVTMVLYFMTYFCRLSLNTVSGVK